MTKERASKTSTKSKEIKSSQNLIVEQNKSLFIIAVVLMAIIAVVGLYTIIDRETPINNSSSSQEVVDDLNSFKLN